MYILHEEQFTQEYVSREPLQEDQITEIRVRLVKIHPYLFSINIKQVALPEQTIAGKEKFIEIE